jgi:hypothetical protein
MDSRNLPSEKVKRNPYRDRPLANPDLEAVDAVVSGDGSRLSLLEDRQVGLIDGHHLRPRDP